MGPLAWFHHGLNFVAPAVAVGSLLACLILIFKPKQRSALILIKQAAINSIAGSIALWAGLWWLGRDGKMASYAAMLCMCATTQWWAMRR